MSEIYHRVVGECKRDCFSGCSHAEPDVVDSWKHLGSAVVSAESVFNYWGGLVVSLVFFRMGVEHETLCLIDYHPYRITNEDGEKVKNPRFNAQCGQLLDVKGEPNGRNFRTSVSAFGNTLAKALKDHPSFAPYASVDIAIIPKSEAGKVSPGLVGVAERLTTLDKRFVLPRPPILTRAKSIGKLANGGNRATYVHLGSISADIPVARKGRAVLLLDDVATTGNSIVACTELLYAAGAGRVFPVVLGRTT